jgi:hypothetical protein
MICDRPPEAEANVLMGHRRQYRRHRGTGPGAAAYIKTGLTVAYQHHFPQCPESGSQAMAQSMMSLVDRHLRRAHAASSGSSNLSRNLPHFTKSKVQHSTPIEVTMADLYPGQTPRRALPVKLDRHHPTHVAQTRRSTGPRLGP